MSAMQECLKNTVVCVLAGGLGTRLQPVLGVRPKILADVGGSPFLAILLDWLAAYSPRKVVLSLGYGAEQVLDWLSRFHGNDKLFVEPILESSQLGTAGALRHALSSLDSDPVMVMNGDSISDANLCEFLKGYEQSGALGSLLCCHVPDVSRFGSIKIDDRSRIEGFSEKRSGSGKRSLVSAGIYLLSRELLLGLRDSEGSSLERDFFQALPAGTLHCHQRDFGFIDIGTPRSLVAAPEAIRRLIGKLRTQAR